MPDDERSGDAVEPARLHAAFCEAFADYLIGPFLVTLEQWPTFLARQCVHLRLSRVLQSESGDIRAFAFVAPRENGRWRLATMGAVPGARGSGAAPRLLDGFLQRARDAGLAEVELEVFARNERARRLYESRGFEPLHDLQGWQAPALGGVPGLLPAAVKLMERSRAFEWINTQALPRLPDLPLQVTPAALSASTGQLQALQFGSALLLFAESAAETLTISSLLDWRPAQRDALLLVEALRSLHPRHRVVVPALQRLDVGGQALRDAGFERQPLHQLLMRARL